VVQVEYKTTLGKSDEFETYKVCVGIITQVQYDKLTIEVFELGLGMTIYLVGLREMLDGLTVVSLLKPKTKRKRKEKQQDDLLMKFKKTPKKTLKATVSSKGSIDYDDIV